jgi:hypothetical protein
MAAFHGRPSHWTVWRQLLHSVRTGKNKCRAVHGVDVWEYRAQHPEEAAIVDAAMTGLSRRVNAAVAGAHDFGRYGVIVDVGGGHSALLAGILAVHPGVRGVLFDQPAVVAGAQTDGIEIVDGSFFDSVPAGGDAYLLHPARLGGRAGDRDLLAIVARSSRRRSEEVRRGRSRRGPNHERPVRGSWRRLGVRGLPLG